MYDHLFLDDEAAEEAEIGVLELEQMLNPNSLVTLTGVRVEPELADAIPGQRYQFLRQGYFCVDPDSSGESLVFNRIVPLRDTWAKIQKAKGGKK